MREHGDVQLSLGLAVAGTVRFPEGDAAEGATVIVQPDLSANVGGSFVDPRAYLGAESEATVDEEGAFRIQGLGEGPWVVSARRKVETEEGAGGRAPGHWNASVDRVRATDETVALTLEAPVTVAGHVVDGAEQPVSIFTLRGERAAASGTCRRARLARRRSRATTVASRWPTSVRGRGPSASSVPDTRGRRRSRSSCHGRRAALLRAPAPGAHRGERRRSRGASRRGCGSERGARGHGGLRGDAGARRLAGRAERRLRGLLAGGGGAGDGLGRRQAGRVRSQRGVRIRAVRGRGAHRGGPRAAPRRNPHG